jgi:hypothetical protein
MSPDTASTNPESVAASLKAEEWTAADARLRREVGLKTDWVSRDILIVCDAVASLRRQLASLEKRGAT